MKLNNIFYLTTIKIILICTTMICLKLVGMQLQQFPQQQYENNDFTFKLLDEKEGIFPLFEKYLNLPEYIFETKKFFPCVKSLYKYQLNMGNYETAIIDVTTYTELCDKFLKTYSFELKNETYIQKKSISKESSIHFIGDLHGNIQALVRMLCVLMKEGFLDHNLVIKPKHGYIVFLGDIVDYGRYGADALALVMLLRIQNPLHVLICRGNHEDINQNKTDGFLEELQTRYKNNSDTITEKIKKIFKSMPVAIFLGLLNHSEAGFIQCCHGGIPKDPEIRQKLKDFLGDIYSIYEITDKNFQWGDFTGEVLSNGSKTSDRFNGSEISDKESENLFKFDIEGTKNYLKELNIKYIFRGHQDYNYACKNLIKNVKAPTCLFPIDDGDHDFNISKYNSDCNKWCEKIGISSIDELNKRQFILQNFPTFIGPVFTFTNASSTKANYDEGFGRLDVKESWENSILQYHIERPEIFKIRSIVFGGKNLKHLSKPLRKILKLTFADKSSIQCVTTALLLPHETVIDEEGIAKIYLTEPIKNTINSDCFHNALAFKIFNYFKKPDDIKPGINQKFQDKVREFYKNNNN